MDSMELVEQYVAAWNAHEPMGFVKLLADGASYWDPIVGNRITGPHLVEYAKGLIVAFPNLRFEVDKPYTAGGFAVFEWRLLGTNTGDGTHPATQRELVLPGVDVIDIAASKITAIKAYFDRMSYAEQMGLLPKN